MLGTWLGLSIHMWHVACPFHGWEEMRAVGRGDSWLLCSAQEIAPCSAWHAHGIFQPGIVQVHRAWMWYRPWVVSIDVVILVTK